MQDEYKEVEVTTELSPIVTIWSILSISIVISAVWFFVSRLFGKPFIGVYFLLPAITIWALMGYLFTDIIHGYLGDSDIAKICKKNYKYNYGLIAIFILSGIGLVFLVPFFDLLCVPLLLSSLLFGIFFLVSLVILSILNRIYTTKIEKSVIKDLSIAIRCQYQPKLPTHLPPTRIPGLKNIKEISANKIILIQTIVAVIISAVLAFMPYILWITGILQHLINLSLSLLYFVFDILASFIGFILDILVLLFIIIFNILVRILGLVEIP